MRKKVVMQKENAAHNVTEVSPTAKHYSIPKQNNAILRIKFRFVELSVSKREDFEFQICAK